MGVTFTDAVPASGTSSSVGMTFGEMQEYVYFLLDETESPLFPRAVIKRLINQGLLDLAPRIGVPTVRQTFLTPLPGGDRCELTLPLTVRGTAVVESVRFDDTLLGVIQENAIERRSVTGTPGWYWLDGGTVRLYPQPDGSGNVVEVEYVRQMQELVDDADVPPLPADVRELACIYAVWRAKLKDDEMHVADRWQRAYHDGVARAVGPRPGYYEGS